MIEGLMILKLFYSKRMNKKDLDYLIMSSKEFKKIKNQG
jgi:hypothetical protein